MNIANPNTNQKSTLFSLFMVFALMVVVSQIIFEVYQSSKEAKTIAIEQAKEEISDKERLFSDFLNSSQHSLLALRETSSFASYLQNKQVSSALTDLFLLVARSEASIMQVRYIDSTGQEILRVDRDKPNGRVTVIAEKDLQNKSQRDYFQASGKKEYEKVWYSALDLNIENNQVEVPYKPTLRAVLPVSQQDNFAGILIINYFMSPLLSNIKASQLNDVVLVDSDGELLVQPNEEKGWSRYDADSSNLEALFAESSDILGHLYYANENLVSQKLSLPLEQDLYLILSAKQEVIENQNKNQQQIILTSLIALFALVVTLLVSRIFFKLNLTLSNNSKFLEEYQKVNHHLMQMQNAIDEHSIVSISDINGEIIYTNEKFNQITGYRGDEVIGKNHRILKSGFQDKNFYIEMYQTINSGRVWNGEKRNRAKDGSFFWVNTTVVPFRNIDGKVESFVSISTDVTKLKEKEALLKKAKKEAEAATEAKSEFLANMSHEIRTPLNGVIGLTDIVLETNLNNTQKDYLNKASKSAKALLHIINEILDYSKIEAGKLDIIPTEFYLNNLLRNLSDLFAYQISEKGLEFIFTIDPKMPVHFTGDSLRLAQILNNLVGNAVKFTQSGYIHLDIKLLSAENQKAILRFSVIDTGIGISEENQKKLFKAFEQGDNSTTRQFGGTGLGLMITKRLVELMGGSVSLQSTEGKGSTFSFDLQLEFIAKEMEHDLSELQNYRFLVVDDSEVDRHYIRQVLSSWGIKADIAPGGQEALQRLKTTEYDCLLLDWKMPVLDGLDLLEELRSNNMNPKKVLMITAYAKEKLLLEAESKGLDVKSILIKPYTPSMLYDALLGHGDEDVTLPPAINLKLAEAKTALLVEDNETNVLVASSMLEQIGFSVDIAWDGKEGIEMCQNKAYDIVFMDLQMPVMGGLEATKIIRTFNAEIPVIALSAAVMEKDKELTKEAGMNHHISKPILKSELLQTIQKYFKTVALDTQKSFESEAKLLLPSIDSFDIRALSDKLQGMSSADLYQLYASFKEGFEETIQTIETMDTQSDVFAQFIHKLKGSSSNMEFHDLSEICLRIEQQGANEQKLNQLKTLFKAIAADISLHIMPLIESKPLEVLSAKQAKQDIALIMSEINAGKVIKKNELKRFIDSLTPFSTETERLKLENHFQQSDADFLIYYLEGILERIENE